MDAEAPDRMAQLQRAMQLITDAIEDLPAECRDLAGNALLNIAAEAVAQDVGWPRPAGSSPASPICWRVGCSRRSAMRSRSTPSMREERMPGAGLLALSPAPPAIGRDGNSHGRGERKKSDDGQEQVAGFAGNHDS